MESCVGPHLHPFDPIAIATKLSMANANMASVAVTKRRCLPKSQNRCTHLPEQRIFEPS